MATAMVIMVREGFEAALVVAIVVAYLRRVGRLDAMGPVWLGVAAALATSVAVGVAIHLTIGDLTGAARLRAFAGVSLLALGVLTWMVFWMRSQSRAIKGDLERRVDGALQARNLSVALALVAFLAVVREGIEASLFLLAAATGQDGGAVLVGGLVGLAVAAGLALAMDRGGRRLPVRTFFTVTGLLLITFAAGLASRSVLYLQSAHDLGSFNLNGVYDVRGVTWLTQDSEVGRFLAALVGWDPRPSIEQVVLWLAYALPVTWLFLRSPRTARAGADLPGAARA